MRGFHQLGSCAAAAAAAASLGLFTTVQAFQPTAFICISEQGRQSTRRWESKQRPNYDSLLVAAFAMSTPDFFGESLPDDDTTNIRGADLTHEMKDKMMNQQDEQYGGGSRFKHMMEEAKRNKMATTTTSRPAAATDLENFLKNPHDETTTTPPPPPPQPTMNQMTTEQQAAMFQQMNPDQMTTEQQAEMFRKIMQGHMAVPTNYNIPQRSDPHRPVGRNRDADVIQNTADLYFAQLKRDSTVRTLARQAGDRETSEAVFQDDGIDMLKDMIYENPYLAGQREKEQELFDTATEERMAYEEALRPKPPVNEEASGVNYKQKLMEKRRGEGVGDN